MLPEFLEKARLFLEGRARAYRLCLHPDRGAAAKDVLADLARFCRAHESTAHADPYMAARLDGRREVFLRIQQHLRLDDETLWGMYQPKGK